MLATKERSYYRTICDSSKQAIHHIFQRDGVFSPPPPGARNQPCSLDLVAHYSFDMAQQVHYPSSPLQPGPLYFLTPRKCAIFGVVCEALPRQVNYLIDEASVTGKGANSVVSMLHHFFDVHGLGESHVHLHADNCVGQNKNNTMVQYLMWRVLTGLHRTITLSFMVVGHTKFAPDWCFGLIKQRYRRTNVSCLDDIMRVVDSSAHVNEVQLVGTQEGDIIVPTYDWAGLFTTHLRKLKKIKSLRHLRFDSATPGVVHVREESDAVEQSISLLVDHTWTPLATDLPELIPPAGLSLERQWYLHNTIAEYCEEEVRDRVCPKPLTPLTAASTSGRASSPAATLSEPPAKKARLCSRCRQPGHTARTCSK